MGPYWSPQIRHIEDGYRSLPFPFKEITPPPFRLVQKLERNRLAAFMGTWSGSQGYRRDHRARYHRGNPGELAAASGDPDKEREVA